MKKPILIISAVAAGTALTAGIFTYLKKDKLPRIGSLKRKVTAMFENRPKISDRYEYDHLRFGGLE